MPLFREVVKDSAMQPVSAGESRHSYGTEREEWRMAVAAALQSFWDKGVYEVVPEEEALTIPKRLVLPM